MSTLKSDSSGNCSESVYGSYSVIHDQNLCKGNSSSPGLVPDPKWWLNHHGLGRVYSHNQLNLFNADGKLFDDKGNGKAGGENQLIEEYYTTCSKNDAVFCADVPVEHFYSHLKNNGDGWLQEFESTINDDLMDLDSSNCVLVEQPKKLGSDVDSDWIGLKKIEPWWHAADKDDLSSLVSQMSSHHVRNCDRLGVESMHVEKVSDNCFDQFEEQTKYKDTKGSYVVDCAHGNLASVSMDKSLGKRGLMDCMHQEPDGTFSKDGFNTSKVNSSDRNEPTSADLSRAELLEALCHSQTRAREAEKLAQEACDEKDRTINLFFQQASCLFAYRQWLRMLQLETLCLHLRSKDQLSSFTPSALLSKGVILRKNRRRAAKKKLRKERCGISKCVFAFAIGLSLAGAGLIVGWTIGWLFPII